ncbi:hypothetical protein THASP1DRAFT_33744 [Thamnocephalis sphaerospora]|uniref:Uncharacterized protein n=1 Tax=Thamnocephalis sphaerospora TaxID=78915 RepID=A0A4P9XFW8_9FUNG|nr:hypothetical protein THASP1DRAFT_33744 [Thamnocephalis sphaerospora]|eukprot:RKP04487.1 hypothetical protein THASP1DRAFT_33744 [Thamnocephalis sphaerospora]
MVADERHDAGAQQLIRTTNDLDPESRRKLRLRRRKLDKLFGEPLDETVVFDRLVRPSLNAAPAASPTSPVARRSSAARTAHRPHSVTDRVLEGLLSDTEVSAAPHSLPASPTVLAHHLPQSPSYSHMDMGRSQSMVSLKSTLSAISLADTQHRRSSSFSTPNTSSVFPSPSPCSDRDGGLEASHSDRSPEQRARELRRKKIEKLFRVLGVHVPVDVLNAVQAKHDQEHRRPNASPVAGSSAPGVSSPLRHRRSFTADAATEPTVVAANFRNGATSTGTMLLSPSEKRAGVRRAEKLERMFGTRPPCDIINNAALMNQMHITSGDSAVIQLDGDTSTPTGEGTSLLDLLELDDEEEEEEGNGSLAGTNLHMHLDSTSLISILLEDDATVDTLLEYVSAPSGNSTPSIANGIGPGRPSSPPLEKGVRQRRMRKLKRFFGQELQMGEMSTQNIVLGADDPTAVACASSDTAASTATSSSPPSRSVLPGQIESIWRRSQRRSWTLPSLGGSSSGSQETATAAAEATRAHPVSAPAARRHGRTVDAPSLRDMEVKSRASAV